MSEEIQERILETNVPETAKDSPAEQQLLPEVVPGPEQRQALLEAVIYVPGPRAESLRLCVSSANGLV